MVKIAPRDPTVRRDVVTILMNALVQDDWKVSSAAASSLPALGALGEPAVPALIALIGNPEQLPERRELAARALVQIARGTASADSARSAVQDAIKHGLISRDLIRWLDGWLGASSSP